MRLLIFRNSVYNHNKAVPLHSLFLVLASVHQNRKAKPNFFFQGVEIALLYFHRTGQTATLGGGTKIATIHQ